MKYIAFAFSLVGIYGADCLIAVPPSSTIADRTVWILMVVASAFVAGFQVSVMVDEQKET